MAPLQPEGSGRRWQRADFSLPVVQLARRLLGCQLIAGEVAGQIVETEAYHQREASCHAARGRTPRTAVLFYRPGHLYVYRIHQSFCLNVTAEPEGIGAAVLIRALVGSRGLDLIRQRRQNRPARIWTDGPGKLCQALAIDLRQNGADLAAHPSMQICDQVRYPDAAVEIGPRIGISKAQQLPWRFFVPPARRVLPARPGSR